MCIRQLNVTLPASSVAGPWGMEALDPLTPVKTSQKRWLLHGAINVQSPLRQISGSTREVSNLWSFYVSDWVLDPICYDSQRLVIYSLKLWMFRNLILLTESFLCSSGPRGWIPMPPLPLLKLVKKMATARGSSLASHHPQANFCIYYCYECYM